MIRSGRPGLISVVSEVVGMVVHVVLGLRAPGDDVQFLADADDAPLGLLEDEHGMAVVFDALSDAELALLLLGTVAEDQGELQRVRRGSVTADSLTLTFDDRLSFTVFQQLPVEPGPHTGLELRRCPRRGGVQPCARPLCLMASGREGSRHRSGVPGRWHRRVGPGPDVAP